MKIGILKADSVREEFQSEFGDYPDMFIRLLSESSKDALSFETYNVQEAVYPNYIDDCDVYIITGSRFSVYEDLHWIRRLESFVVELHAVKKKLVGICFGHQLIALALGGKAELAQAGWGVGVHTTQVLQHQDFMCPSTTNFTAIVSHQDQVTELPRGAECLAGSDFCPNAMTRVGDHILTFQGHPEFETGYSRKLIEFRQEIIGETIYSQGLESLTQKTDEDILAQWILKFCEA
ncbi:MAG: GMP synthase-like glutamine amidotransferase [Flavobacterium sp.]